MGELVFEIDNISAGYDSPLIQGFSARVNSGDFVVVIGRNGAGKSTLLNVLKGAHPHSQGRVKFFNRSLNEYSISELSSLVAVVNTSRPDLPGWKVKDVLNTTAQSVLRSEKDRVSKATELCQIEGLFNNQMNNLSDGEFQKVMLARSICQATPVIILDEPTSFLDVIYRDHVLQIFRDLKTSFNTTLILSSHNFEPLLKRTNQVWSLSDGGVKILAEDLNYDHVVKTLKN